MTLAPTSWYISACWLGKINVIEDGFIKIEDALMNWKTQQFSSNNDKVLANAQGSERDLVIDILKKGSLI